MKARRIVATAIIFVVALTCPAPIATAVTIQPLAVEVPTPTLEPSILLSISTAEEIDPINGLRLQPFMMFEQQLAEAQRLREEQLELQEQQRLKELEEQQRVEEQRNKKLEKKKEEQRKQAIKEKADKEILYKIACAEAGYGNKKAIKNVVYVILNRVNHDEFPDTVEEVVFQKRQFSPISDGRYWEVDVTDEIIEAVDEAYADYADSNKAQGAIFFKATYCDANWSSYEFLFSDGRHEFYK